MFAAFPGRFRRDESINALGGFECECQVSAASAVEGVRARFGRSYAGEPDQVAEELAKDAAVREAELAALRASWPLARFEEDPAGTAAVVQAPTFSREDVVAAIDRFQLQRATAAGVDSVVFDRGGYTYGGRIAALADAARENGLQF